MMIRDNESKGCLLQKTFVDDDDVVEKGKGVGSISNSSSSAVVIEDGSDVDDQFAAAGERSIIKKRGGFNNNSSSSSTTNKIFGFFVVDSDPLPMTQNFFPIDDPERETAGDPQLLRRQRLYRRPTGSGSGSASRILICEVVGKGWKAPIEDRLNGRGGRVRGWGVLGSGFVMEEEDKK